MAEQLSNDIEGHTVVQHVGCATMAWAGARNAPDEALIFPSEKGTPLRPENLLRPPIKPIAAAGIILPVNFQVLLDIRTHAHRLGNAQDVQAYLRPTHLTTTLGVYTQSIAGSVRKLVNAVANDVMTSEPTKKVPVLGRG